MCSWKGEAVITAMDLLAHLEAKVQAAIAGGDEGLAPRLEEVGRFLREIAEAALVAGDEVTLGEAQRLAAKVAPWMAGQAGVAARPQQARRTRVRSCPRCGQSFRGPAGPLDQVGVLLCEACTRELLAGIRL
jgi:hypothetical protein